MTSHFNPSIWYATPLSRPLLADSNFDLLTQACKSIKKSTTSFIKELLPTPLVPISTLYRGKRSASSNEPTAILLIILSGDNITSSSNQKLCFSLYFREDGGVKFSLWISFMSCSYFGLLIASKSIRPNIFKVDGIFFWLSHTPFSTAISINFENSISFEQSLFTKSAVSSEILELIVKSCSLLPKALSMLSSISCPMFNSLKSLFIRTDIV